jgi:hypothetical protein
VTSRPKPSSVEWESKWKSISTISEWYFLATLWEAQHKWRYSRKIRVTGGRCYDHNFLRFSTIFGEKIGVFLKNQCYDHNFCKN